MPISTVNNASFADTAVHGRRSFIVNGAMQVAQRGDVTGISSNSYGGPDRFRLNVLSLGTFSISQSTTAPAGFANSYKVDCTTADASPAAGDLLRVNYFIEGQDLQGLAYGTSDAKAITLSFYVRSNKTGTYNIQFQQPDNGFKQAVLSYTIDSADTWEFKSITVAGDTAGVINNDNGSGLSLSWVLGAGSNYTSGSERPTYTAFANADVAPTQTVNLADSTSNEWLITGVQLELGQTATPFDHSKSYGEELLLCRRYFMRFQREGSSDLMFGRPGYSQTGQANRLGLDFPNEMRAAPTYSENDLYYWDGVVTADLPTPTVTRTHKFSFDADYNVSGITTGRPLWYYFNSTNTHLSLDAEL